MFRYLPTSSLRSKSNLICRGLYTGLLESDGVKALKYCRSHWNPPQCRLTTFQQNRFLSSNSEPVVLADFDQSTGVRKVTLNNPKKRNALSISMIEELSRHLQDDPDNGLRAILINATGEKVFSSGHDLKEMATIRTSDNKQKIFDLFGQLMLSIRDLPVPVICQVDGLAAAAGCQLVASCDIVIATERSSFSTPGADVGLFCSTPGIALSRAANVKTAAFMVLTGRTITAKDAYNAGLVTRLVSDTDQLHDETEAILHSIVNKSRSVIGLGKKFFYKQLDYNLAQAYSDGSCVMVENLLLNDCGEGIDAFVNKRKPNWSHGNQ